MNLDPKLVVQIMKCESESECASLSKIETDSRLLLALRGTYSILEFAFGLFSNRLAWNNSAALFSPVFDELRSFRVEATGRPAPGKE